MNHKASKNCKSNFLAFLSNDRKASANMWWIIIGAVIALVVMIVLLVMFTGKSSTLEGGLLSCESKGGTCQVDGGDNRNILCKNDGGTISKAFTCTDTTDNPPKKRFCCFK